MLPPRWLENPCSNARNELIGALVPFCVESDQVTELIDRRKKHTLNDYFEQCYGPLWLHIHHEGLRYREQQGETFHDMATLTHSGAFHFPGSIGWLRSLPVAAFPHRALADDLGRWQEKTRRQRRCRRGNRLSGSTTAPFVCWTPSVPAGGVAVDWASPEAGWRSFALGDFNDDGDMEIVASRATTQVTQAHHLGSCHRQRRHSSRSENPQWHSMAQAV